MSDEIWGSRMQTVEQETKVNRIRIAKILRNSLSLFRCLVSFTEERRLRKEAKYVVYRSKGVCQYPNKK